MIESLIFIVCISLIYLLRKYSINYVEKYRVNINNAYNQLNSLLDFNNGYFNLNKLKEWKNEHNIIIYKISILQKHSIFIEKETVSKIKKIASFLQDQENIRTKFNQRFVEYEKMNYEEFFNSIEGRVLDTQQREAIIKDEDNNLVIAGAGSGKTTTLVGKVNYLIDRYKIKPEEILILSFTNKSSQNLKDRITSKEINISTFHKYGLDLITEVKNIKPSLFDESQLKKIIIDSFKKNFKDKEYRELVVEYFINHMRIYKSEFDFEIQGDYFQYIKDNDFKAYLPSNSPTNGTETFKYETVKSIQECKIANFLFFNRVHYNYEKPYIYDTSSNKYRQYKPDFTILKKKPNKDIESSFSDQNNLIYLEHFGINKDNRIPKFFVDINETYEEAQKKYLDKMTWCRNLHRIKNTTLIETYSYEFDDNTIFKKLTMKLKELGIELDPMTPKEIWGILKKTIPNDIKNFYILLGTFINLMKSNNIDYVDVKEKANNEKNNSLKKRNLIFLDILKPIFIDYQNHLVHNEEIDFSDMINIASNIIYSGEYNKKIKYILIDEFQDISQSRLKLIKAIQNNNINCKVFCVGDDWQSIYRFTGSDIGILKYFSEHFGETANSSIETTYRFSNPILTMSNNFIMKNENQIRKRLKNNNPNTYTNYKIIEYTDFETSLIEIFDEILENNNDINGKEILILGRYNFDIDKLENNSKKFILEKEKLIYKGYNRKNIEAKFLSIHKAKGLEADIVIIINFETGQYGFPSQIIDDPVLNLLLSDADQFENSEERRLFYVAITRAKETVYLIVPKPHQSKFIEEINFNKNINGNDNEAVKYCPRCITNRLILKSGTRRDGQKWSFWGCVNFKLGCDYKEWI